MASEFHRWGTMVGCVACCAFLSLQTAAAFTGVAPHAGAAGRTSSARHVGGVGARQPRLAVRRASDGGVLGWRAAVDNIEMYRGPFAKPEFLPIGMATGFPKWILAEGDTEAELRPMFNSASYGKEDGWVDPFSFEELWLPSDLPAPVMKPSLAAVARNGQIRYLMPSLDMTVQAAGKLWWNRGFNSIPLACRWMDVNSVNLNSLNLVGFAQDGYLSAEVSTLLEGEEAPKDDPGSWVKLFQCSANNAFLELVEALAGPTGAQLASGFHVVHVPLKSHALLQAPKVGSKVRIFLTDAKFDNTEPNSVEYDKNNEFAESGEGYSELNFLVRAAAPGSKVFLVLLFFYVYFYFLHAAAPPRCFLSLSFSSLAVLFF